MPTAPENKCEDGTRTGLIRTPSSKLHPPLFCAPFSQNLSRSKLLASRQEALTVQNEASRRRHSAHLAAAHSEDENGRLMKKALATGTPWWELRDSHQPSRPRPLSSEEETSSPFSGVASGRREVLELRRRRDEVAPQDISHAPHHTPQPRQTGSGGQHVAKNSSWRIHLVFIRHLSLGIRLLSTNYICIRTLV